eukprot:gene6240-8595_t
MNNVVIYALFCVTIHSVICIVAPPSRFRAVSLFRSDEEDYQKYSAILATSEPFRLQCEEQIKDSVGSFKYFWLKITGKASLQQIQYLRKESKEIDLALARYSLRVENILKNYGMTTQQFNIFSKKVDSNPFMKKKILMQAYFYRIAADVEANLTPSLPILPNLDKESTLALKITDPYDDPNNGLLPLSKESSTPLLRFSRALRSIEYERLRMREALKSALNIPELPTKLTDPDVQPSLNPLIQRACQDFPKIATSIIQRHGLD